MCTVFLYHWILTYGTPAYVRSENEPQLTANMFQLFCSSLGVQDVFTTMYHPQTNEQAECFKRTILHSLRVIASHNPYTWPGFVGSVACA